MKFCCLIVILFCTIHVTTGGRLTGNCLASNGKCGRKGLTCDDAFGKGWIEKGKCCNGGPCCKYIGRCGVSANETTLHTNNNLKISCVPCPEGYVELDDQTASRNCYVYAKPDRLYERWTTASSICSRTPGAYLWRPNSEEETKAVYKQFTVPSLEFIWTGANGQNGNFVFAVDNGVFNYANPPFGTTFAFRNRNCLGISGNSQGFLWSDLSCTYSNLYICEFPRKTCP